MLFTLRMIEIINKHFKVKKNLFLKQLPLRIALRMKVKFPKRWDAWRSSSLLYFNLAGLVPWSLLTRKLSYFCPYILAATMQRYACTFCVVRHTSSAVNSVVPGDRVGLHWMLWLGSFVRINRHCTTQECKSRLARYQRTVSWKLSREVRPRRDNPGIMSREQE